MSRLGKPRSMAMRVLSELKGRRVFRVAAAYSVVAWLLLQLADVTFQPLRLPPWSFNVLMIVLALGFPIALILAWAVQVTPDGIRFDRRRKEPGSGMPTSQIELVMIGFLTVVTGIFITLSVRTVISPDDVAVGTSDGARPELLPKIEANSIAVLPFESFTNDPENRYFGDGIAEELLNRLAQIRGLHVAARTSSFYFRGKQADLIDIANRLAVRHIVEGSVRRDAGSVRVTAQLVDAESGYHLWSRNYNRRLEDILAIQDDIAVSIVDAIRDTLPSTEGIENLTRPGTDSFEAYDEYLRGRYQIVRWTPASLNKAIEHFSNAVAIDDRYYPAYAGLAQAHLNSISAGFWPGDLDFDPSERKRAIAPLARAALDRALELDELYPETLIAEGVYRMRIDNNPVAAAEVFRRVLDMNPDNADAYYWIGEMHLFKTFNNWESLVNLRKAFELDPMNPQMVFRMAVINAKMGRNSRVLELLGRLSAEHPDYADGSCYYTAVLWLSSRRHRDYWQLISDGLMRQPTSILCMDNALTYFRWLGDDVLAAEWVELYQSLHAGNEIADTNLATDDQEQGEESHADPVMQSEAALAEIDSGTQTYGNSLVYDYFIQAAANANVAAGNYARAAQLYERLTEPPFSGAHFELGYHVRLAANRRLAGDEAGAESALTLARSVAAKWLQRGLEDAELFLFEMALLRLVEGDIAAAEKLVIEVSERMDYPGKIHATCVEDPELAVYFESLCESPEWQARIRDWVVAEEAAKAAALQEPTVRNLAERFRDRYRQYLADEQVSPDEQIILERVW